MGPKHPILTRLASAAAAIDGPTPRPAGGARDYTAFPAIGFIRNRRSHRNKGHEEAGKSLAGLVMAEPATKPELEEALAEFAERKIGLLAISGGDGTVRDVLTRGAPFFGDNWPAIIVLPQGKTNALALDLGVPNKWTLHKALEAARMGRFVKRRPLLVERTDGDQRPRYGFILGAGVFNAGIEAGQVAHRYGAFQSFAVAMTTVFGVVQALFGFGDSPWRRLARMRITSGDDGEEVPHSGRGRPDSRFLAGFTTLTTFPPGLRPFSRTRDGGKIRYFILDAPLRRAVALLLIAAMGWDNKMIRRLGMLRGAADEFRIDLDDSFVLDGETYPAGSYRVRPGPEIHFIVP